MFEKEKLTGADIGIDFCGYHLQSPFIMTSGPLTYSAAGMIKGHQAGAGAVVTKTIRKAPAYNPVGHIGKITSSDSLINCEKWADLEPQDWFDKEIPEAVAAGCIVIASVGHTLFEAMDNVEKCEAAGAHMIELVSYTVDTMLPMLDYAKAHVKIPVLCKISANWKDPVEATRQFLEHGADGICAIDSIGPTLKIDIEKAKPVMESSDGYGWLTGAAIKPIALRVNADIAKGHPGLRNLYGSGGCMNPDDAIEYLMIGAMGVGLCSAPILKGMDYVTEMCYKLSARLAELGYNSIEEVYRKALPNFRGTELFRKLDFRFEPFKEDGSKKCVNCQRCVKACSYDARVLNFPEMTVDRDLCRSCGLCVQVCPTRALTADFAPEDEEDIKLAKLSHDFYGLVDEWNKDLPWINSPDK